MDNNKINERVTKVGYLDIGPISLLFGLADLSSGSAAR